MTKEYDLVILGGGTGGYVAAIRASQLGMQVAVVEKSALGGTCLHRGCIPSKALLKSATLYKQSKNLASFGINIGDVTLDFAEVQKRKESIIGQLHNGVKHLMEKGKIDVYNGFGRMLGPSIFSPMAGTISIEYEDGQENTMIVPKNVLIATGSRPRTLNGLEIDGDKIVTSEEALEFSALPNSIMILGAGAIGIEWASMLADFGVKVTVIEYADQILPQTDQSVSKALQKELEEKGVHFVLSAKLQADSVKVADHVSAQIELKDGIKTISADKLLVSIGREANIDGIGLENTQINVTNGYIETSQFYQTKESHIYAIGDCIGGMQLAHVASHEGIVAVEHMAGQAARPIDYDTVASCVYSNPEVATVGITEKVAKERGIQVKVGSYPFKANGKALVDGEVTGFVKVVTDRETDDLLGVHMIGPQVTNMISEAGLAKVLDASTWEITQTIHPHPTLSEVIGEAALAVDGKQING